MQASCNTHGACAMRSSAAHVGGSCVCACVEVETLGSASWPAVRTASCHAQGCLHHLLQRRAPDPGRQTRVSLPPASRTDPAQRQRPVPGCVAGAVLLARVLGGWQAVRGRPSAVGQLVCRAGDTVPMRGGVWPPGGHGDPVLCARHLAGDAPAVPHDGHDVRVVRGCSPLHAAGVPVFVAPARAVCGGTSRVLNESKRVWIMVMPYCAMPCPTLKALAALAFQQVLGHHCWLPAPAGIGPPG